MKKYTLSLFALVAMLALSQAALATPLSPISGAIGVAGGDDTWTTNPGGSVTFTSPSAVVVSKSGSDFSVVPLYTSGATINTGGFYFASPDVLVFTTADGVVTFTITGPITVSTDNGTYLDISGTGILTLTGYAPTNANFNFDSTDSSDNFGLTGTSTFGIDVTSLDVAHVYTPEPSSLLFLGTGLLGMAFVVFRKSKGSRQSNTTLHV